MNPPCTSLSDSIAVSDEEQDGYKDACSVLKQTTLVSTILASFKACPHIVTQNLLSRVYMYM